MEFNVAKFVYNEVKQAGQMLLSAGSAIGKKYDNWCDQSGKKCAPLLANCSGRLITQQLAEKIAKESLKVLPLALFFLALTPTLSVTSLVLVGAVSTAALLLDPNTLSRNGKVKVLESATLAFAVQTALSVGYSLATFSPINAVGSLIMGSLAASVAYYTSRNVK